MAEIIRVNDVSRYDTLQYERLMSQIPLFQMRGSDLCAYIEKMVSNGTVYAIDEGGRLLGLTGFYSNDFANGTAYWSSLAIDPSLHGQGWAPRMMNRIVDDCRRAGMKVLRGRVVRTNKHAIDLFGRYGFTFSDCLEDSRRLNMEFVLSSPPRLSVVCLAYNAASYIRKTLDGFIMQKVDFPFEILVHDDASTDGTADIIREYAAKHPGLIRVILQTENQFSKGVCVSAKFLAPLIRGEFVAVCEGDDYWTDPLKLQKQVDWLDAHPDSSICFHPVVVHFEDNSRPDSTYPAPMDCPDGFTFQGLLRHNFIQTNSVVFRWKLKGREGDVPTDIAPRDWFTNLLRAEKGPIGFIPEAMGVYRCQGRCSPARRRICEQLQAKPSGMTMA